jgi:hypothetical protein
VGFEITDQLLIRFFVFVRYCRESESAMRQYVSYLVDFRKEYGSVRSEVLCSILIEFGVPMKVVRLIETCLNETYSKVGMGKHSSDTFDIQNGLKQGDALLQFLFNFALGYIRRKMQGNAVDLKLNGTHQLLVTVDVSESGGR